MRLASIAVDDELGIKVISLHGRQTVSVRVSRIGAQHLAHTLLEFANVRRRSGSINPKVTIAAQDLTPLCAEERAAARRQKTVRLKKGPVVRL